MRYWVTVLLLLGGCSAGPSIPILSATWPGVDVQYGPPREPNKGEFKALANPCCGSMEPLIHSGKSILHMRPWDGREVLLGKIVDTGEVLHQVVAENERAIKTAGLANKHSDLWTPKEKVRFVVTYIER